MPNEYSYSMKATTIKIEGELLAEIEKQKPPKQSVTSYVRTAIRHELQKYKLAEAAEKYTVFLQNHPDERESLEQWDQADLNNPPKSKSK